MNSSSVPKRPSTIKGCGAALAIGVLTIILVNGSFSLATGNPLDLQDQWAFFLLQIIFVATPFGLLSLAKINDRVPWLAGLVLTATLWGYYLFDGIRYQLSGDASGVNFPLAFLILLSPLIISVACFCAAKASRRWS